MANFIIGSGITSIIFKLYDKNDYKIIGNKIGGQFNSNFQLGPRILKYNEYSKKFIEEFLNTKNVKQYKVGYFYNDCINYDTNDSLRKQYFNKTRGKDKTFENSSMNNGESSFYGYDITLDDVQKLFSIIKKADLIEDNIESLDYLNKIIFTKNSKYEYKNVINTLPINTFYKIINLNKKIEYDSVIFFKVNKSDLCFDNLENFDFVYFPTDQYSFHRLTNIDKEYCVLEVKENSFKDLEFKYEDKIVLKDSILKKDSNIDFDFFEKYQIKFMGRYATASHNVRMHDIIKFSMEFNA